MYKATNIAATTAAVTNRIVASANLKVGAYTIANASAVWAGGFKVTAACTTVDTADTVGTLALVGKGLHGEAVTETLTLSAGATVTSTKYFRSITTATGAGWVISDGNDTIVVGVTAGSYAALGGGLLHQLIVNVAAAATIVVSDSSGTLTTFPASLAVGSYQVDLPWSGFLNVATTSTNDVTVIHTPGVPSSYAMV